MELTILLILIYLIPTFLALTRDHPQWKAIIILNLLAGWTFLGWVAALVWVFIEQKGKSHGKARTL